MTVPRPENIGDIYQVLGYQGLDIPRYGAAYRETDPDRPGHWRWGIEMDDGDLYPWPNNEEMPDMPLNTMELVRRNPMPDWAAELREKP